MDPTPRTCRPSPAARRSCCTCCPKARSSSRRHEKRLGADQAFAPLRESTMPSLSKADHRVSPPQVAIPRDYNAAHDLIERNLVAGRAEKTAFIDDHGAYTYG